MSNEQPLAVSPAETVVRLANSLTLRSNSAERHAGDYVRLCDDAGTELFRWESSQWEASPVEVMADIMVAAAKTDRSLIRKELIVPLADGTTLRSGAYESRADGPSVGEYVRVCEADGTEYLFWDSSEWAEDPVLVMGAIILSASGLRVVEA